MIDNHKQLLCYSKSRSTRSVSCRCWMSHEVATQEGRELKPRVHHTPTTSRSPHRRRRLLRGSVHHWYYTAGIHLFLYEVPLNCPAQLALEMDSLMVGLDKCLIVNDDTLCPQTDKERSNIQWKVSQMFLQLNDLIVMPTKIDSLTYWRWALMCRLKNGVQGVPVYGVVYCRDPCSNKKHHYCFT